MSTRYIQTPTGRRVFKMNAASNAKLMKLLMEGIYSCKELSEETGLAYHTVLNYCKEMHLAKVVHIGSWEECSLGRQQIKIYKFGVGKDAKRRTVSCSESSKRYYAKKKQEKLLQRMAGQQGAAA